LLRRYRAIERSPHWLTNALPGEGWHQWGLAADCYCYRDGNLVQDGSDHAYASYADAAKALGLTAGFFFPQRDSGHVQLPAEGGATARHSWAEIDAEMQKRFPDKPALV
jgi:peptidoglycan LD-endopeptidase CwlK